MKFINLANAIMETIGMPGILLTTMGTTLQIPPVLIGFANPELVDLYAPLTNFRNDLNHAGY